MNKRNIVLTGFMGVGKTSIGKKLAKELNYAFVDTDFEIEKQTNMTIQEIFSKFGEQYFRRLEEELIEEVSKLTATVISTGGGVVLNPLNIQMLKRNGIIVLIKTTKEKMISNILQSKDRPLLNTMDVEHTIDNLLKEREQYYNQYDFIAHTDELDIDKAVDVIIQTLKENSII